jgi:hypothetical protein
MRKPLPAAPVVDATADDPLLPRVEAARLLALSPKTLRDMACNGTGPRFLKRGTSQQARAYYRRSDCVAWLRQTARVVG